MPDNWNEHIRVLMYVNVVNFVLRRPQQQRLTAQQIRIAGIVYTLLGGAGLIIAAVETWRLGEPRG